MIYAILPEELKKFADARKDVQSLALSLVDLTDGDISAASLAALVSKNRSSILTVSDGVAHIKISGVLQKEEDFWSMFFGGVTIYGDIRRAIDSANADESVNQIVLHIDSPGGEVDGVDETAMAIKKSAKKITARVEGMAASAAYWLASQASEIVASSPTDYVGSIGVVCEYYPSDSESIVLTTAKNKRPDIESDAGRAAVLKPMIDIHNIFVARVSAGRGVPADVVDSDAFGSGWVVTADSGFAVGMVDRVENSLQEITGEIPDDNNQEEKMDEKTILDSERARVKGFMALIRAYPDQASLIEADMEAGVDIALTVSKCVAAVADKATAAAAVAAAQAETIPDIKPVENSPIESAKNENPYANAFRALGISVKE